MEKILREFLERYRDDLATTTKPKDDIVDQYAIDGLVSGAMLDHVEQKIIEYGMAHPEAPFWDFLDFLKPGDSTLDDGSE